MIPHKDFILILALGKDASLSFLFLFVTQVLASHLKINLFNGFTALGVQCKRSQFADDTAVFLKKLIWSTKYIELFTGVSGLKMNWDESVLFPLKDCSSSEIENIPVKHNLTY